MIRRETPSLLNPPSACCYAPNRRGSGSVEARRMIRRWLLCLALTTVLFVLGLPQVAALAASKSAAVPAKTYVALGDSYSSGEGLQELSTQYISPSGSDGCDRSKSAYPALVAQSLN